MAHVKAYVDLMSDEAKKVGVSHAVRVGLFAGAALLALIGIVLVGVALLLRASILSFDYPAGWALVVMPLTPIVRRQ